MKHNKALLSLGLICASTPLYSAKKPNIIFFLVDDYGWVDSEVAFGEEVYPHNLRFNTPNMKRLAEKGTILTNAYACPLSTPTRSSLMTGMHAAHEKITTFTSQYINTPTDFSGGGSGLSLPNDEDVFARGEWNYNGLYPVNAERFPLDSMLNNALPVTPMVQILKDNGYYTIHVGKAHWGVEGNPAANPYNMGFVVNVAGANISHPRSYLGTDNYGNTPELWSQLAVQNMAQYYGTNVFLTEALTREALKTMDYPIQHNQPFYLYLSHHAVHTPITADERFYEKYRAKGMDKKQAKYASMVEGVDKSLGDVMDYMEKKGIADNTIIIFYGDNGGHAANTSKGGVAHTQNKPLREGKASVYEGGIREPMMVYWPGKTVAGTRVNTPVSCEDFFPSILEMAGIKSYETHQQIDGQSWARLISKGSLYAAKAQKRGLIQNQRDAYHFAIPESISGLDPERVIISHMPHQWRFDDQKDIDFMSAVRKGEWKLVYRMHNAITPGHKGAFELYNLKTDIGELNDVAGQHPEKVTELAKILGSKLREWNATMPIVKTTGKPCPLPDEIL